jgi:putative transcriptional regulator
VVWAVSVVNPNIYINNGMEVCLMESLRGQFLISTPQMPDPRFKEQVIIICEHNEDGAMGVVINNPHKAITLVDIFKGAEISLQKDIIAPVYIGGPVGVADGFVIYKKMLEGKEAESEKRYSLRVCENVFLSRDLKLLEDIGMGKGPDDFLFLLGYAGWGPGQLEMELIDNGWLTLPADQEIIFNVDDKSKWKMAADWHGIDISIFGVVAGNA